MACGSNAAFDVEAVDSAKASSFCIYKPSYAKNFEIRGFRNSQDILIVCKNPWQNASGVEKLLYINRGEGDGGGGATTCDNGDKICKGSKPALENKQKETASQVQTIKNSAKKIICLSSSHIAMLSAIGSSDKICGVSGKNYVWDSVVANSKTVQEVGYEGYMDYETIIKLSPSIVLLYGIASESSCEKKLLEFGIPYMYIGDYTEEDPLGKAEWMIAVSYLVGKENLAKQRFKAIENEYLSLKNGLKNYLDSLERLESAKKLDKTAPAKNGSNLGSNLEKPAYARPKIMLNAPYNDNWFMPSMNNYSVKLLTDAGSDYIYKKNTSNSSVSIDKEEAYMLLKSADIWLNANGLNEKSQFLKIFKGKRFNNTKRTNQSGGNDYWESGSMRPDLVLKDLIMICHPQYARRMQWKDTLFYYERL